MPGMNADGTPFDNPAAAPPVTEPLPAQDSQSKTELLGLAAQISVVAKAIPTPGVTDSHMHSKHLHEIAKHLRQIAETL